MIQRWRQSLTARMLWLIGAAVGCTILAATALTYTLVFHAAENRDIIHLNEYVAERSQQLERELSATVLNLNTAREAYLKRYRQADPPGFIEQWDHYFERGKDGAWVSKRPFSNDYEFASLWGHRDIAPSADARRRVLVMFEVCQQFLPGWVHRFKSFYGFTPDEMMVIGFNPELPDWVYHQPPDYDINTEEWGKAGLPKFNPSRGMVWTGATPDTTIGESLVQVLLPIDVDGRHLITIGHDMHVSDLVAINLHSDVLGLTHMIFCEDGRIIAHPDLTAKIFDGGGALTMQSSGDPKLAALYQATTGEKGKQSSGYDPVGENYFVSHRLAGPGWLHVTTLPRSVLREQAFQATRWVLWSGMGSLALELGLLGFILRRTVKRPVEELLAATRSVAAGETVLALPTGRHDEIGALARAFDEMASDIRARDEALRFEKELLEKRVTERTGELAQANSRLANALNLERELGELRSNFVSLVSHEFRTPLEVILTSADILDRYLDRLSPEKRSAYLRTIHDSVKRMGGMMEDVLLLGRVEESKLRFQAQPIDLMAFCRRITGEMLSATTHRCAIRFSAEGNLDGAAGDESLLQHILTNLLSNAAKYSPEGGAVDFHLVRAGSDAVFTIQDRGRGIPAADRDRLFQSFFRGSNVRDTEGTGLGLLIVKKCVDIHGGRITFESEPGAGTTFNVALPLFR